MPQLLHYLKTNKEKTEEPSTTATSALTFLQEDLDWGSLDIFTCSANCSATNATDAGTVKDQSNIDSNNNSGNDNASAYLEEVVIIQQLPQLKPKLNLPPPPPPSADNNSISAAASN